MESNQIIEIFREVSNSLEKVQPMDTDFGEKLDGLYVVKLWSGVSDETLGVTPLIGKKPKGFPESMTLANAPLNLRIAWSDVRVVNGKMFARMTQQTETANAIAIITAGRLGDNATSYIKGSTTRRNPSGAYREDKAAIQNVLENVLVPKFEETVNNCLSKFTVNGRGLKAKVVNSEFHYNFDLDIDNSYAVAGNNARIHPYWYPRLCPLAISVKFA